LRGEIFSPNSDCAGKLLKNKRLRGSRWMSCKCRDCAGNVLKKRADNDFIIILGSSILAFSTFKVSQKKLKFFVLGPEIGRIFCVFFRFQMPSDTWFFEEGSKSNST
jgi:hypothetical protein